ncbi:SDR family oxidoreductase [Thermosipho ferrireducens]|uniref:SDR family oxidoreductase n=1 Tax=Thermosipho ferrireducens TaxID=2571116 RepID=A0ABX7S6B7_9BACT|nr:SDR family oxidoreductase [Thermosipho ferrireducens]QTA38127.1 SDR family oxidoreductase [Thermosipho ferrireducens]
MPKLKDFSWALVTGASSGIGEEFAFQLAQKKINLIIHGRNVERLEKIKEELSARGIMVRYFSADFSSKGGVESLIDFVERENIDVDLLINNAGFGHYGEFLSHDILFYKKMIETNIVALTELTYYFASKFVEKRRGGIINVASVAGYLPLPRFSVYAATKAFVYNFSMALWAELSKYNVHVLCLSPGTTKTRFFERINKTNVNGMPVEKVVRTALEAFEKDKPSVIPGFLNKLFVFTESLIPKKHLTKLVQKYF